MAKVVLTKALLTSIADAIRAKTGKSAAMTPAQMASEITAIPTADTSALDDLLEGTAAEITFRGTLLREKALQNYGNSLVPLHLVTPNLKIVGNGALYSAYIRDFVTPAAGVSLGQDCLRYATISGDSSVVVSSLTIGALTGVNVPAGASLVVTLLQARIPMNAAMQSWAALKSVRQSAPATHVQGGAEVIIPNLTALPNSTFSTCANLETIDLPHVTSIGVAAFSQCPKITELNLPAVTEISPSAFSGCKGLVKARIHGASLGGWAFSDTGLATLIIDLDDGEAIPTMQNTNVFNNTPIANGTGFIYLPDGRVEECQAATNWAAFAAQIKPISEYTEE